MRAAVRVAAPKQQPTGRPAAMDPAASVPPVVHQGPARPRSNDVLEPHRRMETMSEAELRDYALQVGVHRRDAANLKVDALKQNILLTLHAFIDD